jgi:hypothetical protein
MFHWARYGQNSINDLRADTGTYQWVAKAARAVLANPYAVNHGRHRHTYQIIGGVEPPNSQYPDIQFLRLLLAYVPSSAESGKPRIRLSTYTPHSPSSIKRYLRNALVIGT